MKKHIAPTVAALTLQAEQMIATSYRINQEQSTSTQLTRGGGWSSDNWAEEEE